MYDAPLVNCSVTEPLTVSGSRQVRLERLSHLAEFALLEDCERIFAAAFDTVEKPATSR